MSSSPTFRLRLATFVAILPVAGACQAHESSSRPSPASRAVIAQLDSCRITYGAAPHTGRPETDSAAAVEPQMTWTGTIHVFRQFSLFVPDSARATTNDTTRTVSLAWPHCESCRFGISIHADSGIGLDARIARIVDEQRKIDSANHDPNAIAGEFDEIDGPPQPFTTPSGRGYLIDNDCGDCAATTLMFGKPGLLATVDLGGDDDVPNLGRHLCEMTAVAKTFAWRP